MGWLLSSVTCTSPVSSFNTPILLMSYVDGTHPQPALCKRSAGLYGLHSPLSFKCDQGMPAPTSHQLLGRFQAPEMLLNASLHAFQSIFHSHSFCRQTITYETIQLKWFDDTSITAPNASHWAVTPLSSFQHQTPMGCGKRSYTFRLLTCFSISITICSIKG